MIEREMQQVPDNATGQTSLASPFTDKAGFARRWQASRRWVDTMLARGMPHLKTSARRVRLCIPECDQWMQDTFRVQRRGGAR